MSHLSSTSEAARLAALYRYEILDTPADSEFDDFTRLAAQICGTPVALISLIDRDRQWFKSRLGIEVHETPLSHSICKTAILQQEPLVVPDATLDPRFRENPLVSGEPHLRFYAGAVLKTRDGHALGTLCVLDFQPREITAEQSAALATLARKVMDTLELRLSRKALHDTISSISDAFMVLDHEHRIAHANEEARSLFLKPGPSPEGERIEDVCESGGCEALLTAIRESGQGNGETYEFQHRSSGRWLAVRIYPAPSGLTVTCRDVTAEREAARQLQLLETCVAHIENIVIITEAEPINHPGPRIVYVNEAFVRQTGYSREEALGRTPRMLQGPATQRSALDRIRAGIAEGKAVREELINYTKSGREFWIEIEITPVVDENGGPGHLIAIQREISGRKEEEAERGKLVHSLGERVKELRTLHEVAMILRHENHSPKQVIQAIADLVPGALQHPDDAGARVRFAEEEAVSAGFGADARWSMEAKFTTRCGMHGSVILIYRSQQADADEGPFLKEERMLIDSIAEMLRSHFERIRAHISLQASEERFRRTFQDAATGIAISTTDGRFLQTNASYRRMLGYSEAELRKLDARSLTWPEDWPVSERLHKELSDGKRETFTLEKRYRHATGRAVWAKLSVSAIRSQDSTPLLIGVAVDITERKRLEQQFLRAQRMESLGTLAGGIAHDLNNVLAPIVMSIDLLKLTIRDPGEREMLSTIETSARRGAEMVAQVLSFGRGLEGQRIEIGLDHLVDDIVRITRDSFPKNIRVEARTRKNLWVLKADPTQLHQVLLNLCVNARDAMPGGGIISIRATNLTIDREYAALNVDAEPGPHILIEVSDEGHGIPPEIVEKIFDPFFTTKEVGVGTGLGLSTSLGIVKSHRGFIRVRSEPGGGTCFAIHLPAEPGTVVEQGPAPQITLPRGQGETVLVVDDELAVRQITKLTLENYGYRVLTAADGVEGFSIFVKNQDQIELVLTDVMMPVMDGPAMIRALHRIDPSLPIIVTSGVSTHAEEICSNHPGVTQFLAKPCNAERLLTAVKEELERRQNLPGDVKRQPPSPS